MSYATFQDVVAHLQQLLTEENYTQAHKMLVDVEVDFPEKRHLIRNYQVRVLAQQGEVEAAIHCFEKSLTDGYWFAGHWMNPDDPDFSNIAHLPKFTALRNESLCLLEEARAKSTPELHLYPPPKISEKVSLLYVLHGNNSNAQESYEQWQSVIERGWLLATPQSSQLMGPHAYVWNDRAIAENETRQHVATITSQFDVDRIVVGGFSRGAGFGIVAIFSDIIPSNAFIGVTPVFPDIGDAIEPHIERAKQTGVCGYVVAGAKDFRYLPTIEDLTETLSLYDIPHQYNVFPDLAHDYPPNFPDTIADALRYLYPNER